jgi:hypothetical protein
LALLSYNSTPAERARYCSFADNFESSWHVQENGGVITGAPLVDFGVTLDGTNDYITYTLQGHEFSSANISFASEFYPDFDTDIDQNVRWVDTVSNDYQINKRASGGNNELRIVLGGTTITNISEVTYSPYWLVSLRNVLVVSGTSGATSVWLNGNAIATAVATAWSPTAMTALTIGTDYNNVNGYYFDGKITSFKVFKSLLTDDDAYNYYHYGYIA